MRISRSSCWQSLAIARVRGLDGGTGGQSGGILCWRRRGLLHRSGAMIRLRASRLFQRSSNGLEGIAGMRPIPFAGRRGRIHRLRPSHRRQRLLATINVYRLDSHPTRAGVVRRGLSAAADAVLRCLRQGGRRAAVKPMSLTSFSSPVPANGPCPYFVPADRHQVIDTRFAYGAGVQSKFPLGLIVARRIRAHQFAIRRSGRVDGERPWQF